MKLPKIVKMILWRLFLKGTEHTFKKIEIVNFLRYNEEYDADMFLVFIRGMKGHLILSCIEHSEDSMQKLKECLENDMKLMYNLGGADYKIITIMHGEEPDWFAAEKKKALETPNLWDKFKSFIHRICFDY